MVLSIVKCKKVKNFFFGENARMISVLAVRKESFFFTKTVFYVIL